MNRNFTEEETQLVSKHMERCSISLIRRELQIITTVKHFFTSTRMTIFFKVKNTLKC